MATIEAKWRCNECQEVHNDEEEALECCRPSVSEVYFCPVCDKDCLTEQDAIECCDFDPEGPPPMASMAEREAAGQLRFFL